MFFFFASFATFLHYLPILLLGHQWQRFLLHVLLLCLVCHLLAHRQVGFCEGQRHNAQVASVAIFDQLYVLLLKERVFGLLLLQQ